MQRGKLGARDRQLRRQSVRALADVMSPTRTFSRSSPSVTGSRSAATPTRVVSAATSTGSPSTSIVSVTSLVRGSTREIVPSIVFATQTEPRPTATPDAPAPTGALCVTDPWRVDDGDGSSTWLDPDAALADGDVLRMRQGSGKVAAMLSGAGVDAPRPV